MKPTPHEHLPQHVEFLDQHSVLAHIYAELQETPPLPTPLDDGGLEGEVGSTETQTNILRGQTALDLLCAQCESWRRKQPLSISIIGVGYNQRRQSAYVPARIAAQAEYLGLSYSLTLTDVRTSVLEAVRQQRQLQINPEVLFEEDRDSRDRWEEYLWFVGCQYKKIAPDTAPLPVGLLQRLKANEVRFIGDDVGTLTSAQEAEHDLIICENVLIYNTDHHVDTLAILNMVRALKVGGWLCLRDSVHQTQYGRWLKDQTSQKELGISVLPHEEKNVTMVQKVSPFPKRYDPTPIVAAMQERYGYRFTAPQVLTHGTR